MSARLVFTAHSIPTPMAEASQYREAVTGVSSRLVADAVGSDVGARLPEPQRTALEIHGSSPTSATTCGASGPPGSRRPFSVPIGFVCDHIEVLYDLDREAADVCRDIGLPMVRAEAVNDDPLFLDMMADVVLDTIAWYEDGRPLPIVAR